MFRCFIGAVLLAFAMSASAEDFNYNFISASYERIELDDLGFDVDGDNWGIGGSFEVGDSWFLFAGYGLGDFDFDVDLDQLTVGGGFHMPLSDAVDFVATLSYVRADISAAGLSFDDNGYGASVGLRAMISERVELSGAVNYADIGDFGDDTSLSGAAWFNLADNFALGLLLGLSDDATTYGIGGRLYFGR